MRIRHNHCIVVLIQYHAFAFIGTNPKHEDKIFSYRHFDFPLNSFSVLMLVLEVEMGYDVILGDWLMSSRLLAEV